MKKTLKNLKEKWECRTIREQLEILWEILAISWLLDSMHCQILAMQYNCRMENLLYVTDFYWLSPVFGIIDLLLSILIIKKTRFRMRCVVYHIVFNHKFEVSMPVIKGIVASITKLLAIYIAICSCFSLLVDIFKFFA